MYINYYSKMRNSFNSTDIEAERKLNADRIVTKIAPLDIATARCVEFRRSLSRLDLPYNPPSLEYTEFRIPKASGGWRVIDAPNPELKQLQRKLVHLLYKNKVLPHNAAHGFTHKRNCLTALQTHQDKGARWFLKLDIKDFFPSIKLSALSTVLSEDIHPIVAVQGSNYAQTRLTTLLSWCTKDGALPQGSPASPILSNLYMIPVDDKLTKLFPTLTYTRYADDLLFSSKSHFDWRHVASEIAKVLLEAGLRVNETKTRYGNFNGSNWNLGLMYNNNYDITVGYKQKKLIKNKVHNLYRDREDTMEWEHKLRSTAGILSYYRSIEPEYFTNLCHKYITEGKEDLVRLVGCDLLG